MIPCKDKPSNETQGRRNESISTENESESPTSTKKEQLPVPSAVVENGTTHNNQLEGSKGQQAFSSTKHSDGQLCEIVQEQLLFSKGQDYSDESLHPWPKRRKTDGKQAQSSSDTSMQLLEPTASFAQDPTFPVGVGLVMTATSPRRTCSEQSLHLTKQKSAQHLPLPRDCTLPLLTETGAASCLVDPLTRPSHRASQPVHALPTEADLQSQNHTNDPPIPLLTKGNNTRVLLKHLYTDRVLEDAGDKKDDIQEPHRVRGTTRPFPDVLFDILQDPTTINSISWRPHGRAFIVSNPTTFVEQVMPRYFRSVTCKYTSFQRQLSLYGFLRLSRKDTPDCGAYYHEYFLRGHPRLCRNIDRKRVKGYAIRPKIKIETEPNLYEMPYCGASPRSQLVQDNSSTEAGGNIQRRMVTRSQVNKCLEAASPLSISQATHGLARTENREALAVARRPSIEAAADALLMSPTGAAVQEVFDWDPRSGWPSTSSASSCDDNGKTDSPPDHKTTA